MQYSIVNYEEISLKKDFRIDPEYWHPKYMKAEDLIKSKENDILNNSTVKGGKRLPLGESFVKDGISYIRVEDIKNSFVEYENSPKISIELHSKLRNYQTKYNDVLLTIVGSIGDVGIVKFKLDKCNLTENCVKIIPNSKLKPEYLFVFLKSKYGQNQIHREKVGTTQPKLAIVRIKSFKVPLLRNIQQKTVAIVNKSYELKENSKSLYKQAQELLLEELGLTDWKPKHKLCSIKNFSEAQEAQRIDAEYFQPKYNEIIESIKKYSNGWDNLGNVVSIKDKNFNPEANKEYKYIELSNISNSGEITGYTKEQGKDLPTRARRIIKTNDLVVSSIEGSLESIALVTEQYNNALCSNGFYVINSVEINSETLLCFMKSCAGYQQLKKGCNGTILTAINKDEFCEIVIPKIKNNVQEEIKEKITESSKTREQSKQLLEIAKRGVEIAIEENEESATSWINQEIEKLGVEL